MRSLTEGGALREVPIIVTSCLGIFVEVWIGDRLRRFFWFFVVDLMRKLIEYPISVKLLKTKFSI